MLDGLLVRLTAVFPALADTAEPVSVIITIPVRIMYVGDFRFTATVADCATNALYTGPAISVEMAAVSSMNKPLVIASAVGVPLCLAAAAFVLTRNRKR